MYKARLEGSGELFRDGLPDGEVKASRLGVLNELCEEIILMFLAKPDWTIQNPHHDVNLRDYLRGMIEAEDELLKEALNLMIKDKVFSVDKSLNRKPKEPRDLMRIRGLNSPIEGPSRAYITDRVIEAALESVSTEIS